MAEVLRGGLEDHESLEGGLSSGPAPQESTQGTLRVKVGEVFMPFSGLGELPAFDPAENINQDLYSVKFELEGIPGTLTLFPDVEADKDYSRVERPPISVEAKFRIRSLDQFEKLSNLRLQLALNRHSRYLDLDCDETAQTVQSRHDKDSEIVISSSVLYNFDDTFGMKFAFNAGVLRRVKAKFIPRSPAS